MEEKIRRLKSQLSVISNEYQQLNRDTKGSYNWREQAIETQLEVIDTILDGSYSELVAGWELCLKEDKHDK